MQYGVCADPKHAAALEAAGFEFIELHVQNHLKTTDGREAFLEELGRIQAAPLPALAANCFVPGYLKITGPEVDWPALEAYVTTAFRRAHQAGIQSIVFGSGGARQIPEGFDRGRAWGQLVRFGKLIGPLAAEQDVVVVVEPLNRTKGACNVLTSVGESARYVNEVAHPNVRLLVDAYHLMLDDDSLDDVVANGHLLRHVHVATLDNRRPPGLEPCDFSDFFRALKLSGYDGPISIEASWDDFEAQALEAYEALVTMVEAAG
ncbi:MAG: sugar phosphate isomerase/epimerase family protein [Anaerolineae bacterium]